MPRFFVEGRPQGEVLLGGEDGRHIVRSLRMRPGEALTLCDGQGTDYACTFVSAQGESALVRVEEAFPNRTEPRAQVTVCQCLAKGDKLETVTQKAVELGAARQGEILFFYERGQESLKQALQTAGGRLFVFVGPEGGFAPEEAALAQSLGAKLLTLGPRILRTETAPLAALAAILYERGDMER